MKRTVLMFMLLLLCTAAEAKKWPWKGLDHDFNVTLVRSMGRNANLLKVFSVGKNADAAIDQALQDAVACAIFSGYATRLHDTQEKPLWAGFSEARSAQEFYEANKQYFDNFFKTGEFLNYAKNVNTGYPSGENNIAVSGGRQVGLNVSIAKDALREKLEKDGIIHKLMQEK